MGTPASFVRIICLSEHLRRLTTAFVASSAGLQQIFMIYYADAVLFEISSSFLPVKSLSEEFKKDRESFNPRMQFGLMEPRRPIFLSKLRSHLMLIQKQLAKSSSPFLLDTPQPSLADVALFTIIHWAVRMKSASTVLVLPASKAPLEYRRTMEWVEAVKDAIDSATADQSNPAVKPEMIDGAAAVHVTLSSPGLRPRIISGKEVKVDQSEPLVQSKWLAEGDFVSVTPTDTGIVPQLGQLVGLTSETVSLKIQPPASQKSFLGHFPRLGYAIEKVSAMGGLGAKL